MGPLMKEMGAPWLIRQMMDSLTPVWTIQLSATGLALTQAAGSMPSTTNTLAFGQTTQFRIGDGTLHPAQLGWDAAGRLVTGVAMKGRTMRTTYWVEGGELHAEQAVCEGEAPLINTGAAKLTARRVFKAQQQ
jgi:hypothetical protein